MEPNANDSDASPTRWSLLTRLKNSDNQDAWREFFDTYWRLIYSIAIKSGLTDAEAQDVVQDTVITVARNLGTFKTDPVHGSFKAWLMKTTRWRIINQFNKRRPDQIARVHRQADDTRETATVDRIGSAGGVHLDALWDMEWREHVLRVALDRLRGRVKPKHFQIFYLHVIKGQPASEVAQALGVSAAHVYLVKHRLARPFQEEIKHRAQAM
jgi:RNA polymerase sigma-70 factor (ECF subfamily)